MSRVFLTAFQPYGEWQENSSWLALLEFTQNLPDWPHVTTRRYPVDFPEVQQRLENDLSSDYDYAIHLGQAPGASQIKLESIGLNIGGDPSEPPETYGPLISDGPTAYRTQIELSPILDAMRADGIPTGISFNAGTYLCNAAMYYSHHLAATRSLQTKVLFVHLPLAPSQIGDRDTPSMDPQLCAAGLKSLLQALPG
jgi:pyroglutamyl-peptidase